MNTRIQYRCRDCPEEFTNALDSNNHRDATGHHQSFRCWDRVCGMALSRHSDDEYARCAAKHFAPTLETETDDR